MSKGTIYDSFIKESNKIKESYGEYTSALAKKVCASWDRIKNIVLKSFPTIHNRKNVSSMKRVIYKGQKIFDAIRLHIKQKSNNVQNDSISKHIDRGIAFIDKFEKIVLMLS